MIRIILREGCAFEVSTTFPFQGLLPSTYLLGLVLFFSPMNFVRHSQNDPV